MAWIATVTFTTGNVLTAAQMNSYSRDNLNFLHSPPGCLVTRTTTQSIASSTNTLISYTAADIYDSDSMHDPVGSPTLVTFNTAGVYTLSASCQFAANNTGRRDAAFNLTSTVTGGADLGNTQDNAPLAGIPSAMSCNGIMKFNAGDTAGFLVFQTSGGALNVLNSGNAGGMFSNANCVMSAQWISDGS